jgi:hypothetical protein
MNDTSIKLKKKKEKLMSPQPKQTLPNSVHDYSGDGDRVSRGTHPVTDIHRVSK